MEAAMQKRPNLYLREEILKVNTQGKIIGELQENLKETFAL